MDVLVGEVARLPVTADKVVDRVRVTDTLVDLLGVAPAPLEGNNLAEVAHDLEVTLRVFITVRDNDLGSLLGKLGDEVATKETRAAKDGRDVTRDGGAAASGGTIAGDGGRAVGLGLVEDSEVVGRL